MSTHTSSDTREMATEVDPITLRKLSTLHFFKKRVVSFANSHPPLPTSYQIVSNGLLIPPLRIRFQGDKKTGMEWKEYPPFKKT